MKTTRILFVMALALSVAFQAEAKKVKLEYKLKAGDQFKYETTTLGENAMEVMGQSQTTSTSTSHIYDFKVLSVTSSGLYVMNVSKTAFSMKNSGAAGEMSYNSLTDTLVPDFAKIESATLNQIYTFNLSPLGLVTEMKAPEGVVEKVNKIVEGMSGQAGLGAGNAGIAASAEGFQKVVEGILMSFPEGGAQAKEPWEIKTKTMQMISFNVLMKYELVNSSKETNEIKLVAQITQDPDAAPMEMNGMNLSFELLGSMDGKIIIDAVTGLPNSSEMTTSMSGAIAVDSPQLASPMSMPMTTRSTQKLTKK